MAAEPATTRGGESPARDEPTAFWLAMVTAFVFGALFSLFPVTFPVLKRAFATNLEQMGRVQLVSFLSSLGVSVLGGWFVGHLGLRRAAAVSLLLLALAVAVVGAAPAYAVVLLGAAIFGLALAAIAVIGNSVISDHLPHKQQSVFFASGMSGALGATLGPALLGYWLGYAQRCGLSWRLGYFGVAALLLAAAIWALLLDPRAFAHGVHGRQGPSEALLAMRQVLRSPALYSLGLAMFLHSVAQVGMTSWTGQLYQNRLSINAAQAAYFLSLNSAGFFGGRMLLGWITSRRKVPQLLVLASCAAGGTVAFLATIASHSYLAALAAFTLAGVFISGDAPSVNSFAGLRFAQRTTTAFALLGGIGNLGAAAGPYLTGLMGARFGLETAIRSMPVFSLALALLAVAWYLRDGPGTMRPSLGDAR